MQHYHHLLEASTLANTVDSYHRLIQSLVLGGVRASVVGGHQRVCFAFYIYLVQFSEKLVLYLW